MPLQITEFAGVASINAQTVQLADGPPVAITAQGFVGEVTVGQRTVIIKISGSGTIAWPGQTNPESFNGTEYRRVRPGNQFTVA